MISIQFLKLSRRISYSFIQRSLYNQNKYSNSSLFSIPPQLSLYEKVLHDLPNNSSKEAELMKICDDFMENEKYSQCIELLLYAIKIYPNSPRLLCKIGTAYIQSEELALGAESIENGLSLDPHQFGTEGWLSLASVYKMNGAISKAKECYLKSIELGFYPAYSHSLLALLCGEQREYETADKHFKISLQINPNDFSSQWAYGELVFQKDQEEGVLIMSKAAQGMASGQNDNTFVYEEELPQLIVNMNYRIGQILQKIFKNYKDAAEYFQIVINTDPKHVSALIQYAECLRKISIDNEPLAQELINKAKLIDPKQFEKKLTEWWN